MWKNEVIVWKRSGILCELKFLFAEKFLFWTYDFSCCSESEIRKNGVEKVVNFVCERRFEPKFLRTERAISDQLGSQPFHPQNKF